MNSETFVEDWNKMFPSAKIHPNELASPTEAFLTNALVTMFRAISIDLNREKFDPSANDPETVRRNKLELFQYVNDLYRSLHNKKFHYFDLIQPAPKKTLNLLQTLLNYVLYHLMVDDEVTNDCMDLINKRRESMAKKQKMLSDREKNKMQVQQGQRSLEAYSHQLDEVNKKIGEEKKCPCLKEYDDNVQLKTKQTQKMAGLKIHIADLNSQCINEDEYAEMKSSIFEIQELLSEKQEALEKMTSNHEIVCADIASVEKRISLLEAVNEMIPDGKIIQPGKLNDKKEELLRTMISHEEIKKKIEDMKVQVEQYQQNVNEIRKKQGDLNQSWAKKCEPVEKLLESLSSQSKYIQETVATSKVNMAQSKLEVQLMLENAQKGLDVMRKSYICDVELNDENSPHNF